jgi:acyl-coenzyme A thioesterase PaaI-like protein
VKGSRTAGLTEAQRRWRFAVESLVSYRYLGTYSEARGRHEAEGWITLRRDLRGPVGLLAAPLGIALLDTAGINVDPLAVVSPTRIDLHLFEPAPDVARVHLEGRVLREGRSQFFTESRLTDADDPARVIGLGSTHWAVAGPNPGFHYVDHRPGVADVDALPPLYEPFGAHLAADGELEIRELTPAIGSEGLHQGPFQVVPEAAAMIAAERATGTDQLWIAHQGTSIVGRGVGAPLVTRTEVLRVTDHEVDVRVELRARGDDDRLCSVTLCRFVSGMIASA